VLKARNLALFVAAKEFIDALERSLQCGFFAAAHDLAAAFAHDDVVVGVSGRGMADHDVRDEAVALDARAGLFDVTFFGVTRRIHLKSSVELFGPCCRSWSYLGYWMRVWHRCHLSAMPAAVGLKTVASG
jgi:hypothetical protein